MDTRRIVTGLALVIGSAWGAGIAQAQLCENTCEADVVGPRQGRHTWSDTSADSVLWPPNHKFATITVSASNNDGDECDVTIDDVRQDEAVDEVGSGGANHSPDATNCSNAGNASRVDLRGERSGTGTGRYYHISFTMEDPDCMMPKMDEALVLVPHDQGVAHLGTWLDEGGVFGSDGSSDLAISCLE
ncbi:MAG TPA: hypothetical protein VGC93_05945 [Thermoanaerobaculia bacterium]